MFSVQHDDERRQTGRLEERHQEAGPADMDHQRKTHTELPANVIATTITIILVLLSLFFSCFVLFLQKMKLVPVSARGFGNFFEGDCYIVLNVSGIVAEW